MNVGILMPIILGDVVSQVISFLWWAILDKIVEILHCPAGSCTVLQDPALSCRILHYPAGSCTILQDPALNPAGSHTFLHYPALSCRILHYRGIVQDPTLSCRIVQDSAG